MTSKDTKDSDEAVYAHTYMAELQDLMLAAQIQVLREDRGLSQQALGELTGMAQSRISLLESADYSGRTIATLRKLAAAFDVGLCVSFVPYHHEIRRLESRVQSTLCVPSRKDEPRAILTDNNTVAFTSASVSGSAGAVAQTPTTRGRFELDRKATVQSVEAVG